MPERKDLPSFDDIYEAYAEGIYNLVYRLTEDEENAEDLLHDILIKVYENIGKFENRSHISTWIYRIAYNHVLNFLKKRSRLHNLTKAKHRQEDSDLPEADEMDLLRQDRIEILPTCYAAASPERILEDSERDAIVRSAVSSLPFKHLVPLVLRYYERMSYKHISEVLKISVSAAETRIHRAKAELVRKLRPYVEAL